MLKHSNLIVEIDADACLGEGACTDDAPTTFRVNASGIAVLCAESTDSAAQIRDAARNCPAKAITVTAG
jgi:ferredoxin